jgi:prepilin-type N-terminal cleavage/methylation domain-containing protein
MTPANTPAARRLAFSLIEILVVMVIIVVLSSITYGVYLGHSKNAPAGKAHAPIERAKDIVCTENLRQVRMSIDMSHSGDAEGKYPASLAELRELPAEMRACPVGKEPYQYDSTNGTVRCVHPGHESY